jgi:hypothetical protein
MFKFIKNFLPILAIFCFFNYSYADKPWDDAMTIAKTKDKVLELVKKDK